MVSSHPISVSCDSAGRLKRRCTGYGSGKLNVALGSTFGRLVAGIRSADAVAGPGNARFTFMVLACRPRKTGPPHDTRRCAGTLTTFCGGRLSGCGASAFGHFRTCAPSLAIRSTHKGVFVTTHTSRRIRSSSTKRG